MLEGATPRLIDEWQEAPPIWDAVRYQVDQRTDKGQFILTGSATPNHKGILHSGAGRIARLRMQPAMTVEVGLKKLIELIIRGGWPGSLSLSPQQAALLPGEYLDAVIDDDVQPNGRCEAEHR